MICLAIKPENSRDLLLTIGTRSTSRSVPAASSTRDCGVLINTLELSDVAGLIAPCGILLSGDTSNHEKSGDEHKKHNHGGVEKLHDGE